MKPLELRQSLSLSLIEFAAVVGVTGTTAHRWERGVVPRAGAILDRLAELEREAQTVEGRAAIVLRAVSEIAVIRFSRDLVRARKRYAEAIRIPVERLTGRAVEDLGENEKRANAAYSAALDLAQRRARAILGIE